jgi:hypothetical protein
VISIIVKNIEKWGALPNTMDSLSFAASLLGERSSVRIVLNANSDFAIDVVLANLLKDVAVDRENRVALIGDEIGPFHDVTLLLIAVDMGKRLSAAEATSLTDDDWHRLSETLAKLHGIDLCFLRIDYKESIRRGYKGTLKEIVGSGKLGRDHIVILYLPSPHSLTDEHLHVVIDEVIAFCESRNATTLIVGRGWSDDTRSRNAIELLSGSQTATCDVRLDDQILHVQLGYLEYRSSTKYLMNSASYELTDPTPVQLCPLKD